MIVWVDDCLFEEGARDVDLLALLRGASIRRHTMFVSASPAERRRDWQSPGFQRWEGRLSERIRNEVKLLAERLTLVSGNVVTRGHAARLLVSNDQPHRLTARDCWVTMDEAVRAVMLPTYVLLENGINDRAFLRRAMPSYWRERLDSWERIGLLRYENGGGNSAMARLVKLASRDEEYTRQAFGLPYALWRMVHIVVFDHDGESADRPGKGSADLAKACQEAGLDEHAHRLARRDQEHYLPAEALRTIVEKRVTDPADREPLMKAIDVHMNKGAERHFAALPDLGRKRIFKNEFDCSEIDQWQDAWFGRDGAWPEMTLLAEKIAAAI